MKSFFAHIKDFFTKIFGSTTWERVALNTLAIVGPLLETLIALTAGEAAAEAAAKIINIIQSDLQTAQSLITSIQSGGGSGTVGQLQNVLNGIKTNLAQLEAAAQIKNPDTQAKVTAVVNTVLQEVDAVLEAMPPATPAPPAAPVTA